ncbi:T6SS phospholipase effector Tle1-like catalytic domain-containing protein [Neptunicella marina]|uniref:DUF2235 domain-containing protein n=1 Tax=Neptunicella marina TaxID=2125989 RepID=A0A8J6IVU1_9ALTE|nr:DUF2235 domain-containing protein [Neptunicella marina]MBC3766802.1 DUF2235 domain-containing protein [Neptunicella marina]
MTKQPTWQIGVFFDGTGNNKYVDYQIDDDQFEPTNIAKLYELYPSNLSHQQLKIYIKGCGTKDVDDLQNLPEQDPNYSRLMMATGFDVSSKVYSALEQIAAVTPEAKSVCIDVFGFSRGATASRFFINKIRELGLKGDCTYWPAECEVRVRFCGLFDTVGSIGLPGDKDNLLMELDLSPDVADYIYHLTASHEYRDNFPLTSILTLPIGNISSNNHCPQPVCEHFVEEALYGSHADIGGGYAIGAEKIYLDVNVERYPPDNQDEKRLAEEQTLALLNHWQQKKHNSNTKIFVEYEEQLTALSLIKLEKVRKAFIVLERHVSKELSFIALEKMLQKALSQGVPFNPLNTHDIECKVPTALRDAYAAAQAGDKLAMQFIEQHYIHHSHQLVKPKGELFNAMAVEQDPEYTTENGKREVFYNTHKTPANINLPPSRLK